MGGGNSSDGRRETRSVLGDVTNQLGKRGFSFISGKLVLKSGDGYCINVENKDQSSEFAKKVSQGAENLVKEKCTIKCVDNDKEKPKSACVSPRSCSEINFLRGNVISSILKISSEIKEPSLSDGGLKVYRGNAVEQSTIEVCDDLRHSISMPMSSFDGDILDARGKHNIDEGRLSSDTVLSDSLHEQLVTQGSGSDGDDLGVGNFASSQTGSIECSRVVESQESKTFGLERCNGIKGETCSNLGAAADLIKACSCSFCTKAAYIWSDLHYQDIKSRIAALKKSQKEASILLQRSCLKQGICKPDQGNSNKSSKLESDLMGQWRSLFLYMEDVFGSECSQLETGLLALKDLRENCKTELESFNVIPSEKQ